MQKAMKSPLEVVFIIIIKVKPAVHVINIVFRVFKLFIFKNLDVSFL